MDAFSLGNSWAENCAAGLTAGTLPGGGNWELLLGVLVRDCCVTDYCCKPLSHKALASLALWVETILRCGEWISRIHIQKAQRLLHISFDWRHFVPDEGHCKYLLVAFMDCLEAQVEAMYSVLEGTRGRRSEDLGRPFMSSWILGQHCGPSSFSFFVCEREFIASPSTMEAQAKECMKGSNPVWGKEKNLSFGMRFDC